MRVNEKIQYAILKDALNDYVWHDDELALIISEKSHGISLLSYVIDAVNKMTCSNEPLCTVSGGRGVGPFASSYKIKYSCVFKQLANCLKLIEGIVDGFSEHELHPCINLLLKIKESADMYYFRPLSYAYLTNEDMVEEYVNSLNNIGSDIFRELNSSNYKKQVNDYQRSARKNYKSARRYIKYLFNQHSKLLVIRIDLSYKKDVMVACDTAQRHRDRFFSNTRNNSMFENMVGYMWKLEYGVSKGYHNHVMLFFNGSIVRQDITYAKRVGDYWNKVVTKGDGLYYNCNAVKNKYISCGIGLVHYRDKNKLQGLDDAIRYLTLTDKFIKIKTAGVRRAFGRGGMIKRPTKRGPPQTV